MFIVPVVYVMLRKKPPVDHERKLEEEAAEDMSVLFGETVEETA